MTSPEPTSTNRPPRKPSRSNPPTSPEPADPVEAVTAAEPLFQSPHPLPPREVLVDEVPPFDSASPLLDEMPERPTPTATGSSPEFSAADRRLLKETVRRAVEAVGNLLNKVATVDRTEREAGLYQFDADEQEGIADPVAGILGRRGIGVKDPDLNDAIRGAIALATYVGRQLSLRRDIRRAKADVPQETQEQAA